MSVDYYKTLQISPTATLREVKTAYKKCALQYHPDKNPRPEAQQKFRDIQKAYEILSDTNERRIYDEAPASYGSFCDEPTFYQNPQQTREQDEYLTRRKELSEMYERKVKEHAERRANPNLVGTSLHYRREKEFCLLEVDFLENEKLHFEREIMHCHVNRMKNVQYHGMPPEYYQKKIARLEIKIKKFQQQAQQYEEQEREQEEREGGGGFKFRKNSGVGVGGGDGEDFSGKFPALVRRAMAALFERHLS